jgi:hypothetical protein
MKLGKLRLPHPRAKLLPEMLAHTVRHEFIF